MFKNITKTILIISFISLLNDFSSEMLYPIIPLYLKQIGYGTLIIGILEGLAECIAGFSKMYMGSLSDKFQKRLPFIQFGYALSIISRPLIGISNYIGLIFTARSFDRIGKGIRSGARDALLSDEANKENHAEVFGFHRSMDTLGAVLGPLVALIYLYFNPENYKTLFLITLAPGLISIVFTFFLNEKNNVENLVSKKKLSLKENLSFYKQAPLPYLKLVGIFILFSLVNSSDMFLLLRAKEVGFKETEMIMLYILFNLVYAFFAFPIGKLADKMNKKIVLIIGLLLYALSYFLFSFNTHSISIIVAFILYGLFYAFTNGIIKVILIEKVSSSQKASAIGFYEGLNSFGLLLANLLTGFIWYKFGAEIALGLNAFIVLIIIIILIPNYKLSKSK